MSVNQEEGEEEVQSQVDELSHLVKEEGRRPGHLLHEHFTESKGGSLKATSAPRSWKILVVFLIAVILALAIALGLAVHKNTSNSSEHGSTASNGVKGQCYSAYKQDVTLPTDPTVFQDLSTDEYHNVRDYLLKQASLNLTLHSKATQSSNFIYLIELYLPDKQSVLNYLDKNGPKPVRRARAVIINGAKAAANVEEYLVSPLPKPTKHTPLLLAHRRQPIPYSSRPFSGNEETGFEKIILQVTSKSYVILKESFGFWYGNCTKNCLRYYIDGAPASFLNGARQTWVAFFRDRPGYDVLPVPFEILINHADVDIKKWKVEQIYYHNQYFTSTAELVQKYNSGSINKTKFMLSKDSELGASFQRRGQSFLKKPMREPTLVNPNGYRFDIRGQKISYLGWDFHVGVRSSAGPALYDVRFNNSRVLYELSMQEATSFYSAHDPRQSSAQYLDSSFRIGSTNYQLLKGVDCPEDSVFLDSFSFVDSDKAQRRPNSVCVFEVNHAVPLRRHIAFDRSYNFAYVAGLSDTALVVRSVTTPQNYDYVVDFIIYQTGMVETRISTSGYIIAGPYYQSEAPYAFENLRRTEGTIHDHIILFKADLDVVGQSNSYQTLDIELKNVSCAWNDVGYQLKKQVMRKPKATEKEALLHYNFDIPKYLVVYNDKEKNKYGNKRGYRLQLDSMVKQKYPEDYFITKSAAWSKYQLAVTKYKDSERYGSSIHNQYGMDPPVFDFDDYVKDNENIENQDLVAWISMGVLHIPNTEDIPVTVTTGNRFSFFVRPYGYFDEDPSMGSTNAVIATSDGKGGTNVETYGTPDGSNCPVPSRKITYKP